ncbi:flagellin N-terminal helical domain-containing protein [Chromobacterium phragmitis]|uniref:flagellin N-terminal helical domain-containing protein n=1 Tax=Chromobacterium phragmitis TaxID=2202141 RepID=UPI001E461CDE|nr:flagellin [Chromobacterium phragmitis]
MALWADKGNEMAITVNTNLSSLQAQLNLNNSSMSLNQSLQRLSSGFRINSGKDDAAGLAISQTLTSAIRGNNQAMRNANDGVSVGQTAEGAMGQIANNLQRIREIAVQASNGGVSDTNRSQLQNEVNQLTQEISRTIQTTEFNGTKLLAGGANLTFQVGSEGAADNQISIQTVDLTQSTPNTLSGSTADLTKAAADAKTAWDAAKTAYGAVADATTGAPNPGVTQATADEMKRKSLNAEKAYLDTDLAAKSKAVDDADKAWQAADTAGKAAAKTALDNARTAMDTAKDAQTTFSNANPTIGASGGLHSFNANLLAVKTVDVTSQDGAAKALNLLSQDIAKISDLRSTFGSVMNRFDAVVANLGNYTQNLTAANSRIMDVDFASETANLTKGQILQQAGGSILKQANSLPQAALSLLQ